MRTAIKTSVCALALLLGAAAATGASAAPVPYPTPTSLEPFRFADPAEEIALARTAAPASISNDAEVLTLGRGGYETAVKGTNGFVCFVDRSWSKPFDDPEFWSPKIRAPQCSNLPAARSVLPATLERARWVMTGVPKDEIASRTRAATATAMPAPEPAPWST